MDIHLQPDAALNDNQVHVSPDLDYELMAVLKESDLDIVVDDSGQGDIIRMSSRLVDRICEWMTLRRFTSQTD